MDATHAYRTPAERLLYRWFVQYNPLYLLSAVLVLVGLTLMNRGLAHDPSSWAMLSPRAITELYALALIGASAVLTRLHLPRPAVFVALLAVVYQGDLTLGTATYSLLPTVGRAASVLWLALFVVKLYALAWALRLKLSPSSVLLPSFAALGLALIPHLHRRLDNHALSAVVALWLFGVCYGALATTREIRARLALDEWGQTVLRRSVRATWTIWAVLGFAHVLFWTSQYHLRGVFLPVALLVATRWIRRELAIVASVAAVLLFASVTTPHLLGATALMSTVVLAVSVRQLAWTVYASYIFLWSLVSFPHHALALEVLLAGVMVATVWRSRRRLQALPLLATYVHWSVQAKLLRAPQSSLEWGVTAVVGGFALLLLSTVASWRVDRHFTTEHAA